MKPLYEWIDEIQDDNARERFRKNIVRFNADPDREYRALSHAIDGAFTWSSSREGQEYWSDLHERAKEGGI